MHGKLLKFCQAVVVSKNCATNSKCLIVRYYFVFVFMLVMMYAQVEVKEAAFMHELVLVLMGVMSVPDADARELADSETDNSFRVGGMAHVGVFDFKSVISIYF